MRLRKNKRAELTASIGLFVILAVFLSLSAYLIGQAPATLIYGPQEYGYETAPDTFDFLDLSEYAESENFTVYDGFVEDWGKATFGHDMKLSGSDISGIWNTHYFGFFQAHNMEWFNANGTNRGYYLTISEITTDQNSENITEYQVICDHFTIEAYFGYDQGSYSSFQDAWDNDEVQVLFTIGFDDLGSTWNAWSIVGNLLTFRAIDIGPPYLTWIFGLVFYCAIAGLLLIILTQLLPFGG